MILSIITVNKNNSYGLRKTMLSVVQQSFSDFEYIIIDGNSSDNSVDVIKELLANSHFQSNWVSENDSGIYNAMNKGIKVAKGDYLLFLNSGDSFTDNDCLQKAFENRPESDIINARCNIVDSNNNIVWTSPYLPTITLKTLYSIGLPHQSTFIKRELFDRYGLYREDFRYNADIAFWYKAILFGGATTTPLDLVITNYDQNGISSTESKTKRYLEEMDIIFNEGILPRVIPDYKEEREYRETMKEFEWIVSSPKTRRFLGFLRKIFKHLR